MRQQEVTSPLFHASKSVQRNLLQLIELATNAAITVLNVTILKLVLSVTMDSSLDKILLVEKFYVLTDALPVNTMMVLGVETATKTAVLALMAIPVIHANLDSFGTQLTYLAQK
jgi:hypothetical protein